MTGQRFQAFGVGCAKTGTKSLAHMFGSRYRAAHEPCAEALIELILAQDRMPPGVFRDAVRDLFVPLNLEMNASQLNGHVIEDLVALFPDARFVLTLREPAAWVRSFVNHQLTRRLRPDSPWWRFRDLRFLGTAEANTRRTDDGLYTLEQYLDYWLAQNTRILRAVPRERLLVVSTESLTQDIPRLAAFLRIPADTIAPARANVGDYDTAPPAAPFDAQRLTNSAREYARRLSEAVAAVESGQR